tara:strand:- start:364 stop:468 length:105 start_codon:yes stop_codon:yes gene_type:complete
MTVGSLLLEEEKIFVPKKYVDKQHGEFFLHNVSF